MGDLKNKKVLLFSPKFFNYEVLITKEIEKQGGIVHLYDERNNPSSIEKILLRKAHFLMVNKVNKKYRELLKKEKDFNPDIVLFVSPESVTKKIIKEMKCTFSSSIFILYMYDSIGNKNAKNIYKLFDKCFSFDPNDCKKYNFYFRPLFFSSEFEKRTNEIQSYVYDFSFIGTIHSDRAKILNDLRKEFIKNNLTFYYYLFIPGKMLLLIRKLLNKNVRELEKYGYVHTKSIDKNEVARISADTMCIIDINHPNQIGLTMRTIEMLGLKRKILTTNKNIESYDFFNSNNQIVIDRKDVKINYNDIKEKYEFISNEIYNRYKLCNWIKEITDSE